MVGNVFTLVSSEPSSLGTDSDGRGVERRVGGVSMSTTLGCDTARRRRSDMYESSIPTARMGFGSTTTGAELSNAPKHHVNIYAKYERSIEFHAPQSS
jgi:hypothetical protein